MRIAFRSAAAWFTPLPVMPPFAPDAGASGDARIPAGFDV